MVSSILCLFCVERVGGICPKMGHFPFVIVHLLNKFMCNYTIILKFRTVIFDIEALKKWLFFVYILPLF
jgi:hypothetical protein